MQTQEKFVITISRELGSGGRTIGRKLAGKLGVRYCDKLLVQSLVEKFNLTTYEIEKIKGQKKNWLSDFLDKVAPIPRADLMIGPRAAATENPYPHHTTSDELFAAETEILNAIADEASCVIAGRSGFFVLKDRPNKLDILIRAPRAERIARVMRRQNVSQEEAETLIDSVDAGRDNFVKHFAGVSRYDARNYDLVLNVGGMSEDDAVEIILDYIKHSA